MNKNPFNLNTTDQQSRALEASKAMGAVATSKAEEIAKINQQAAQKMAALFQEKVSELLKTSDPKSAFDMVHAQVLQDAAKEVMQYQASVFKALGSGNQELVKIAQALMEEAKEDLIHFVNDATQNTPQNTPLGVEAYASAFKDPFGMALQNFELMRAAMAESFGNFEKSVQNVGNLSKGVSGSPAKKTVKKS
jgi:hypothetical protein